MNPPAGKTPLVWRLLSNRLVENEAQASELIDQQFPLMPETSVGSGFQNWASVQFFTKMPV